MTMQGFKIGMEYLEDTGSSADSQDSINGDSTDTQVRIQANKVTEKYYNLGYREGFFEAKATAVQHSFDLGFYHGAIQAIKESLELPNNESEISPKNLTIEDLRKEHELLKQAILSIQDSPSKPSSL